MIGVITGLEAEARIARRWSVPVAVGGGTAQGAGEAANRLAPQVQALISFGLAGGLDPVLHPGDLIVPATIVDGDESWPADPALATRLGGPTIHILRGGGGILATPAQKRSAFQQGAHAVDLESAAVARAAREHGLPFAALRAICDPAARALPHAALAALDAKGRIALLRVALAALTHPIELPTLLALARDAASAHAALRRRVGQTHLAGPTDRS